MSGDLSISMVLLQVSAATVVAFAVLCLLTSFFRGERATWLIPGTAKNWRHTVSQWVKPGGAAHEPFILLALQPVALVEEPGLLAEVAARIRPRLRQSDYLEVLPDRVCLLLGQAPAGPVDRVADRLLQGQAPGKWKWTAATFPAQGQTVAALEQAVESRWQSWPGAAAPAAALRDSAAGFLEEAHACAAQWQQQRQRHSLLVIRWRPGDQAFDAQVAQVLSGGIRAQDLAGTTAPQEWAGLLRCPVALAGKVAARLFERLSVMAARREPPAAMEWWGGLAGSPDHAGRFDALWAAACQAVAEAQTRPAGTCQVFVAAAKKTQRPSAESLY